MTTTADRTATSILVSWALDVYSSGVRQEDREIVRYLLTDHVGNALGGLHADSTRAVLGFVRTRVGACPALGGGRLVEEYAAFVEGASAHALEFDDTHQPSSSHPGSAVFPAALTIAAAEGKSFDQFVAAVVAGYEVAARVGVAATASGQYERGFHPTGTSGVFGATVAAGLLAGLSEAELRSALGIALATSSGSMAFLADGGWTKRLHPGWAAHSAIIAARLASHGFYGPQDALAGPNGFLHSYSGRSQPELLTAGLGEGPLAVHRTSIKAHSCCRYMQAPIDAIRRIMKATKAAADDVDEIAVGVLEAGWDIIAEPTAQKLRPKTVVDAQFSMPFGAACAVLYDKVGVSQLQPEVVVSAAIESLMDRVRCYRDKELDAMFPAFWPAQVVITLRDGRRFQELIQHPKGDPENPLSTEEMTSKFSELCVPVVTEHGHGQILACIQNLGGATKPVNLHGLLGRHDILREA